MLLSVHKPVLNETSKYGGRYWITFGPNGSDKVAAEQDAIRKKGVSKANLTLSNEYLLLNSEFSSHFHRYSEWCFLELMMVVAAAGEEGLYYRLALDHPSNQQIHQLSNKMR